MLDDAEWRKLEPLIEACRPRGKTPPQDLRRTVSAILWRHQNGAKWRAIAGPARRRPVPPQRSMPPEPWEGCA